MRSGVVEGRFTRDCFTTVCPHCCETVTDPAFDKQIVHCRFVAVQHAIQLCWLG